MKLGFVNYVRNPTRETAINGAVARLVIGGYLFWKTMWYDWHEVLEAPFIGYHEFGALVPASPTILVVEKYVLGVALVMFVVGYRLRLSAFVSTLLVSHLGIVRFVYNNSGGVTALFIASYFLIFFGLYRHTEELSIDAVRRARDEPLPSLVSRLKSSARGTYRMDALRWCLLVFGIIYFGSGFDKVMSSGLGWISSENLSRIINVRAFKYEQSLTVGPAEVAMPLGSWLTQFPELVWASSAATLALELGLLPAALLGLGVTPFFLGLFGMTTVIWLTLGILFGDVFFFMAMFFAWDALYERVVRDRELDLVFDERCLFCVQSLYPFKLLDVNDTVTFYSQSDAPDRFRDRSDIRFSDAMYVFHGDTAYAGYYAFRELLDQFRVFFPLVWLMRVPYVEGVGTRVYRYVADQRSRHFTCAVDAEG